MTSIGSDAFRRCSSLTSISIGNGVTSIGPFAFEGCSGLTSVHILDLAAWCNIHFATYGYANPCYYAHRLFLNGAEITNLSIPDSVTNIGDRAFEGCSGLTSVMIPDSVNSIGGSAFYNCSGLTSVTIGNGVTLIGNYAFSGCSGLTSVTIPNSVTNIGDRAFSGCRGLTSVMIGNGVIHIGELAFNCSSLTSFMVNGNNPNYSSANGLLMTKNGKTLTVGVNGDVTIPESVAYIESWAFSGCSGLTSVTIPDSVTSIGGYAFHDCSGLTSVTIPDSVNSIGDSAFYGCSGLTSITIPDSVTSIGSYAFSGCSGLTSITIPMNVTNIGDIAFGGCSNLSEVLLPRCLENENLSGMSIPDKCSVSFYDPLRLDVLFNKSTTWPQNGEHWFTPGVTATCASVGVATTGLGSGFRCICTGWRGTGSVPANGTDTNVTFKITEDSSITWLWATNIWLECSITVDGRETNIANWIPMSDSPFTTPVKLDSETIVVALSGEMDGVAVDAVAGTISIPADRPRTLSITIESITATRSVETSGKPIIFSEVAESGWRPVADAGAADGFCIRSGEIDAGGTSYVETTLIGPGALSFKWKVPAGRGDYARVYMDGEVQKSIQRVTAWQPVSLDIPAGEHTIRWSYERGSGSATGDDAAFLDDVDWRPEVSLAVASAFGTAKPDAGTHTFVYGDEVVASAVAPEPENGIRRVCTGWTGTGSASASGAESGVTFTITNDMSIVWNWRTDYLTGVSVSGGSGDFGPQWVASGEMVEVALSPAAHLYEISLSGDTEGVTLDGTTLRFVADKPRQIDVTITEVKVSLAVDSEWGVPSPTNGVHALSWGTLMSASVAEPEPTNGVQYVCTGWTGTGSVPESGTGTNVAFTIESDSSIRWNWQTNVWISIAANGPVGVDVADGWFALGEAVVAQYSPNVDFFTIALSGDTDGVVLDESARTIAIPADRPRSVTLSIAELTLKKALDAGNLTWGTSGNATWFPQIDVSADGVSSARSGGLSNGDEVSALETTVQGGGTFAWSWRLGVSGDSNSGVDVLLDGDWLDSYYPGTDWSRETLEITGDGEHTIRFEFWNAGTETGDCAYLDQVSWSGGVPSHDIVIGNVRIPSDWIDENAASALAKANGDYETAANATAANGINKVWECFVAGINPEDPASKFEATIDFVDGKPIVRWNPPLSAEEEAKRTRKILGRRSLDDPEGWQDVTNLDDPEATGYRFFKVSVEMK